MESNTESNKVGALTRISEPPVIVEPPLTQAGQQTPPRLLPSTPMRFAKWQLLLAFAIAGVSDLFSAVLTFTPPLEWALDFFTAFALFVVLGWRWMLLPGLIFEAIPGLSVFPFWVMVVAAVGVWGKARPA